MTAEKDVAIETPPCASHHCKRRGYIKSERYGAYLCSAHALVGPVRFLPPADQEVTDA